MFWNKHISKIPYIEPDPYVSPRWAAGKEFHIKEYEALRKEITDHVGHTRKLEIYALAGIAAFYAWYLAKETRVDPIVLCLPVLIAFLGAFRSWSTLTRIFEVADYLRKLENQLALNGLGWEMLRGTKTTSPFVSTAAVYWAALILISLVALNLIPSYRAKYDTIELGCSSITTDTSLARRAPLPEISSE